jgi:ABC-type lipoprotein export system ATPase subunit
VLADEPTSALDDASTLRVLDLLRASAAAAGAALVIATHDRRLEPALAGATVLRLAGPA